MVKYRKKPIVIDAIQWDGKDETLYKIIQMKIGPPIAQAVCLRGLANSLTIPTLEGDMRAIIGDWIIKGVKGELYPCKPDIFEATYDLVEETE